MSRTASRSAQTQKASLALLQSNLPGFHRCSLNPQRHWKGAGHAHIVVLRGDVVLEEELQSPLRNRDAVHLDRLNLNSGDAVCSFSVSHDVDFMLAAEQTVERIVLVTPLHDRFEVDVSAAVDDSRTGSEANSADSVGHLHSAFVEVGVDLRLGQL